MTGSCSSGLMLFTNRMNLKPAEEGGERCWPCFVLVLVCLRFVYFLFSEQCVLLFVLLNVTNN